MKSIPLISTVTQKLSVPQWLSHLFIGMAVCTVIGFSYSLVPEAGSSIFDIDSPIFGTPPGEPYNIEVTGIEISQGMQNLANDMPLVANRQTIVRVYARETTGRTIDNVKAMLFVSVGAPTEDGGATGFGFNTESTAITVTPTGGSRLNFEDSFNFDISINYPDNADISGPGSLTIEAEVNWDRMGDELDATDNQIVVGRPLHLIAWDGYDADGDDLVYTLFYSSDGGKQWTPLRFEMKETRIMVDQRLLDDMAGSRTAMMKVLASDGVNTGIDVTETAFASPGAAPHVAIQSPQNGIIIAENEPLLLIGHAIDKEDGILRDAALLWSSDRDGRLGTGHRLRINNLSSGHHTITLVAIDRDGMTARSSVSVTIKAVTSLK